MGSPTQGESRGAETAPVAVVPAVGRELASALDTHEPLSSKRADRGTADGV